MADKDSVVEKLADALFVAGIECTLPQTVIDAVADAVDEAIAQAVVTVLEELHEQQEQDGEHIGFVNSFYVTSKLTEYTNGRSDDRG